MVDLGNEEYHFLEKTAAKREIDITINIPHVPQWLSGSVSRFHATGLGFKSRARQGRFSLSSLQWIDNEYQSCLVTEH
ncbi:hypothetical protein TNCV_1735461 [Trichonephila clavipes]|nr:hypothetical protein TNCV_1735461 [Trichonephila clavipes]